MSLGGTVWGEMSGGEVSRGEMSVSRLYSATRQKAGPYRDMYNVHTHNLGCCEKCTLSCTQVMFFRYSDRYLGQLTLYWAPDNGLGLQF